MDRTAVYRRRWGILGVLVTSLLVVVLDNSILNIALRVISDPQQGLGASQSQLAWAINSYTLVFAGLLFTWGVIGDRVGRKRILLIGLALFGLASLLSAYAQTPQHLIWARALMGLGGAAVMPQTLSIISNVFPAEERPRAIGIWAGSVGLALGIGPPLGGLLLEHFWWGSVFLINVPIVIVGLVLMAIIVPESRNEQPARLDPVGVALSILGLVLLVYGIITAGDRASLRDPDVIAATLGGLVVLAGFVVYEARIDHPALNVRLFRQPRMAVAVATIMLMFFSMAGVLFFISFYWQSVREFSPLHAGLLVLPLALSQGIVSPLSGFLVTRFGPKRVCATGLVLASLALGSYSLLDTTTPVWLIEIAFFVQGTGMAMVMLPATDSIMATVPREEAGTASAVQNTARQVAMALGVAVLGAVVTAVYRSQITPYLDAFPPQARANAVDSIEATMALAERLGQQGQPIIAPAKEAFLSGMHLAALSALVTGTIGLVLVLIWLPRHASNQQPQQSEPPAGTQPQTADTGRR
ncbi:MFS transporter [Salinactinospora qingdaonensis]|uniref:MFS transporter n=1 Tax=Salinactinospora qingdaonensis TaxID=702744 RepID=A0ABP7FBT1_9ACTN